MEQRQRKKSLGGSVPDPDPDPVPEPDPNPAPNSFFLALDAPGGTVVGTPEPDGAGTVESIDLLDVTGYRELRGANGFLNQAETMDIFEMSGGQCRVKAGSVADFMGGSWIKQDGVEVRGGGLPWYALHFRFNFVGGGSELKTYRVRPIYTRIEPTGDETGNEQIIDTLDAHAPTGLRTRVNDGNVTKGPNNRTIKVDPNLPGVYAIASNSLTWCSGDNITFEGHPRAILFKDAPLTIRGPNGIVDNKYPAGPRNHIWRNGVFAPGDSFPGVAAGNRDGLDVLSGYDIAFINCTVMWSLDELMQVTNKFFPLNDGTHRILFYRCLFAEALASDLHPEGSPGHPYGPLVTNYANQVHIIESVIYRANNRNPALGGFAFGFYMANCLTLYGADGGFIGTQSDGLQAGTPMGNTVWFRNNLVRCGYRSDLSNPDGRHRAIVFRHTSGDVGEYFFDNNHFWSGGQGNFSGTHDFTPDLVDPAEHYRLLNGASAESIKNYPPFAAPPYPLWPLGTESDNAALFHHLVGETTSVVGSRYKDGNGDIIPGNAGTGVQEQRILSALRNGVSTQSMVKTPSDVGGYAF